MINDLKGFSRIALHGKLSGQIEASRTGAGTTIRLPPCLERGSQRKRIPSRHNIPVNPRSQDFRKAVGVGGDHRQASSEGFKTGVREGIIPGRQCQDIRRSEERGDVSDRAEKMGVPAGVEVRRTTTCDEQRGIVEHFHGFDGG